MSDELPLILEPEALQALLGQSELLVVHIGTRTGYVRGHIANAVHLEYEEITWDRPPVSGLLPHPAHLERVFSSIGLRPDTQVVVYDDLGGAQAARLLWTLHLMGHTRVSFLNGGWHAWTTAGLPLDLRLPRVMPSAYRVRPSGEYLAERDYILVHLEDPGTTLLDVRSQEEYSGEKCHAARGGHIPGALHLEWTRAIDPERAMRLRPEKELRALFAALGIDEGQELIVYCQTHRRSSHTYVVLRALGFQRVRGYPGAWSEWGNLPDSPVETV